MFGKGSFVTFLTFWFIVGLFAPAAFCTDPASTPPAAADSQESKTPEIRKICLKDAVDVALKNNQRLPASRSALAGAEAQHQQALSAFWPQIALRGTYTNFDDNPNFIFPARSMAVPSQAITIPANAFMPGFPQTPINLQTPAGSVPVPEQNVKLMNKSNLVSSLNVNYPLFTGGLRLAKMKQAQSGVEATVESARQQEVDFVAMPFLDYLKIRCQS